MSVAARRWLPVLALAAVCVVPSSLAMAGGDAPAAPSAPSDRDRAVAAALEATNIRMKAKVEEAALLDKQGRSDEALAALRAVEAIHREGMALVDQLTALGAPIVRPAAVRVIPGSPGRLRVRIDPPLPFEEVPPRYIYDAATYLLGVQRIDGWFRPIPAVDAKPDADLDEGHDLYATSLAVVALLDSLDDDLKPSRTMDAASRGVEALLGAQDPSGAFGDGKDLEAHAVASWAVAAGAARLPHATWRPAAQQAIARAVAFTLARRDTLGMWSDGVLTDDDWIVSAWMAISLHEIHSLPRSFSRDVDLGVVLNRVTFGARERAAAGNDAVSPAARFARALLLTDRSPEEAGPLPTGADDDVALLFGTTLRFGRSYGFDAWQDDVLTRSQQRQRHGGPLQGSWDPSGTRALRHGRTYATACRLLAALVPVVPYREPEPD